MALLKLSGLVTKISGKIGGSVLGTSGSGSYIKQNSYSQFPNTLAQQVGKVGIYDISQRWRNLTDAQRALWVAETPNYPYINRVGDTVQYTGYGLFLWCNNNLKTIGYSPIDVPSTFATPVLPTLTFQFFTDALMQVLFSSDSINNTHLMYASRPMNNGLMPKLSEFRAFAIRSVPSASFVYSFKLAYEEVFGNTSIGQTVWVYAKTVNINTGAVAGITNIVGLVKS